MKSLFTLLQQMELTNNSAQQIVCVGHCVYTSIHVVPFSVSISCATRDVMRAAY